MSQHDRLQHLHPNLPLPVEPATGSIHLAMSRWANQISRHVPKYLPTRLPENSAASQSDQGIAAPALGTSAMSMARVETENGNEKADIMALAPIALAI